MSATQILREYGQAIRGDWSDIDGRSVLANLEDFAKWIEEPETYPGDEVARNEAGLCLAGAGHWCGSWHGYCNSVHDPCGCSADPRDGATS